MANLTDGFKIHFDKKNKDDKFIIGLVKKKAKTLVGSNRISKYIAKKAVKSVISDFQSDNDSLGEQLKTLIPEQNIK